MPTNLANFSNRAKYYLGTIENAIIEGGDVLAKAYDSENNVLYIGGNFTTVNGQSRIGFAAIDNEGALLPITANINSGAKISAMVLNNGYVYVGGNFTNFGVAVKSYIARISTVGVEEAWGPNFNGEVYDICFRSSDIAISGAFTLVGTSTMRRNTAIVNFDGSLSSNNIPVGGSALSLSVVPSTNDLAIAGSIQHIGGSPNFGLVSQSTLTESSFNFRNKVNGIVHDTLYDGNGFYLAGEFTQVDGQDRIGLAYISNNGQVSSWVANLGNSLGGNGIAYSLSIDSTTGTLYVAGNFLSVNGTTRYHTAAFDSSGNLLSSWNVLNVNALVRTIVVSGSMVYIGGDFTNINGNSRSRLAAINTSGTLQSWAPVMNGSVYAILVIGSSVYVGGSFTTANGISRQRIAKLAVSNGATDPNFRYDVNNTVWSLATRQATWTGQIIRTIIAGGDFTQSWESNGTFRSVTRLVEFNETGQYFSNVSIVASTVRHIEVFNTIDMVVCGNFGAFTVTGSSRVLRHFNMSFVSKIKRVDALSSFAIAGSFELAGGSNTPSRIAAFNSSNSVSYVGFLNNATNGGTINKIVSYDNKTYAVGNFFVAGWTNNLAAISDTGAFISDFAGSFSLPPVDIAVSLDGLSVAVTGPYNSYAEVLGGSSETHNHFLVLDSSNANMLYRKKMNPYFYSGKFPEVVAIQNGFIQIFPRQSVSDFGSVRVWDTRYQVPRS